MEGLLSRGEERVWTEFNGREEKGVSGGKKY